MPDVTAERLIWWTLRIAAAMCFIGHGAFGLLMKEEWVPFFALAGISRAGAYTLMPLIGVMDIVLGLAVLVRPTRAVLLYMAVWAMWTAALRPLTGDSVFEMLERAGNYGVPLALLAWVGLPLRRGSWWGALTLPSSALHRLAPVRSVLVLTTALLLIGHGGLALTEKPLLVGHAEAIGLSSGTVRLAGAVELLLAGMVLILAHPALLLGVVSWKAATEALFLVSGAPIWEFIERGGSYGAPLALAIVIAAEPSRQLIRTVATEPNPLRPGPLR